MALSEPIGIRRMVKEYDANEKSILKQQLVG
jgi:hypothetical protein